MITDLRARFSAFLNEEAGAVSVDWVVLCAALAAMTVGLFLALHSSIEIAVNNIGDRVLELTDRDTDL